MKKMDKMKKFLFVCLASFLGLALVISLGVNLLTACAEETTETSTESTAILDESATDKEVIADEGTSENNAVLDDENNAKLDEIKEMVQGYIDSRKDEEGKMDFGAILSDAKTWVISAISFILSTFGGAIVASVLNRINKNKDILTEAQIVAVATSAAQKAVEKVVGKSIDIDISAEVSKAVKKELYAISNALDNLVDGMKNTEMLVAHEAVALSHSRIIGTGEKAALVEGAKKAEEHAGKVVSTAKIEIEATEPSTKSSTENAENVEQKNMSYINFDGVGEKK